MNRKQFMSLVFAVLALGAIAVTFMKREQTSWEDASGRVGQSMLPDFDINKVAQVTLSSAKDSVTLTQKEGAWRVKERNDYPADFKNLSELLIKLRELKIVQVEAIAPEQRAQLELEAPGKEGKTGTLLEMNDAGGKTLAALLLGKDYLRKGGPGGASYPTGRFVMAAPDRAGLDAARSVYVVGDTLTFASAKAQSWVRKEFFKVAKVAAVDVKGADSARSWRFTRAKPDEFWKLEGIAAGAELEQVSANQAAGALEEMLLTDVAIGVDDAASGMNAPSTITVQTFDNLTYALRVGKKIDDGYYARVALTGEAPTAARTPAADEKPEDKEKLDKAFNDELAALKTRLQQERALADWTFVVPGWKLEAFMKTRAQLLVDKSKPRAPEGAGMPQGMPMQLPPGMQMPQQ
jgi:hypothetical protein